VVAHENNMEKKMRRISRIELFSLLLMAPSAGINWPNLLLIHLSAARPSSKRPTVLLPLLMQAQLSGMNNL
jgi:hypothetical protein